MGPILFHFPRTMFGEVLAEMNPAVDLRAAGWQVFWWYVRTRLGISSPAMTRPAFSLLPQKGR